MRDAKRPTGVIVATLLVVVATMGSLVGLGMLYMTLTGSGDMPPWMTVVVFSAVIFIIGLWVRFKEGRRFSTLGFSQPRRAPAKILRGVGGGLLAAMVSLTVLVMLGQGTIAWNGNMLTATDWLMIVAWIGIYAVQSSSEEIAVRGFATQAYARRFGLIAALVMQGILFAALHSGNDGFDALPILNLFLVSIMLGCWMVADGGLWGTCAFHATWNWSLSKLFGTAMSGQGGGSGIFIVTPANDGNDVLTGGQFGIEGSVIVSVVLIVAIACLAKPVRRVLAASARREHPID